MHYTIAIIEDVHGDIKVNFDATGNKYLVGILNAETRIYKHKTFDKMADAYKVFEKLSRAIVFGEYSEADRMSWLAWD